VILVSHDPHSKTNFEKNIKIEKQIRAITNKARKNIKISVKLLTVIIKFNMSFEIHE